MTAFILEVLLLKGWRRGGEVYWTQDDAERAGRSLLKRKTARAVRVLPVDVTLNPVVVMPEDSVSRFES